MAQNQVSTGFSMYNPRRLERVSFGSFAGCTIDQFTDPVAQNPSNFLNLQNVMPSLSGGFSRRWGTTSLNNSLPSTRQYQRMFPYTVAADTTFSGTQNTRCVLATDNTYVDVVYNEIGGPVYNLPAFSGTGNIFGVTSRDWFYAMDGVGQPKKIDYSQVASDTHSNWGIAAPSGTTYNSVVYMNGGLAYNSGGIGTGYTSAPTVVFTGGGGTGAAATASIDSYGRVIGFTLTATGINYTSAPIVSLSGGGGTGGVPVAVMYTPSGSITQEVAAVVLSGNIIINEGRTYGIAFQNSVTGHVSDYIYQQYPSKYLTEPLGQINLNPNQGCDSLYVPISFTASSLDPQVDHVVLIASSDGGDVEHMYQVAVLPLSDFTLSAGTYSYTYVDTTPDTYTDTYQAGPTLLTQNLWVDTDAYGDPLGIFANTPPLVTLNKPICHQGRMFATDGKSLYFSKSIDEVTTSTGLITSKWEEAWPGDNVLDIAYDDELITALLSDGTYLYIGTTDNIYRLTGSSTQNFSIPSSIFRGVGVSSQDTWSVIYKDNVPAGYLWTTPDNKIMLSDFNTYNEIGKPIYPLLEGSQISFIQSLSYGPYSLVFLSVTNNSNFEYLVYDSKNGGWYQWFGTPNSYFPPTNSGCPSLSYTNQTGIQQLLFVDTTKITGTYQPYLLAFDPAIAYDVAIGSIPQTNIPYLIETSWINLQDTASSIVLNELEVWTNDVVQMNVSVYRANSFVDFANPVLVRTGTLVQSPFGEYKMYLAGAVSFGRFHKVQFFSNQGTGTVSQSLNVLSQFQFEHFPHTRS